MTVLLDGADLPLRGGGNIKYVFGMAKSPLDAGGAKVAGRALASAAFGKKLGEEALRAHILLTESGVVERPNDVAPFNVNWDFYGTIP